MRREDPVETAALLPFVCQLWRVAGERDAAVPSDMAVPAPMVGERGNRFLFFEEEYVMEQVVVTVEALRCHRCRQLIHPSEPFFQHQMMTAVSVGRHDTTHTYTLEDVCRSCHDALTKAAEEAQRRARWRTFWLWAFMGNVFLAALLPVGLYPFYAAVIVRNGWKWWAKRRLTPSQTAQQVLRATAPSAAAELTKSDPSS